MPAVQLPWPRGLQTGGFIQEGPSQSLCQKKLRPPFDLAICIPDLSVLSPGTSESLACLWEIKITVKGTGSIIRIAQIKKLRPRKEK